MKVRKIAALAVGAAMVGATIGLAGAQPTVPDIPKEFFVKDGEPNVKIIVGSQAAAADVASAADIAIALGSLLYTEKEVEASGEYVKVKTDTAYDPKDIPVFKNYYNGCPLGTDLTEVEKWWNGSYDAKGKPIFNAKLDKSAWANGVLSDKVTPWNILVPKGVEWIDGNNNNYWTDPNGKTHDLTDVKIHYTISIGTIELKQLVKGEVDTKDIDDFKDFTLVVDNVVANVTFKLNAYGKKLYDKVTGEEETTYKVSDTRPRRYTLHKDGVIKGVEKGDTIDLFGKTLKILDIGKTDKGTPYIEHGKDWGTKYLKVGEAVPFGDYTVKVLDIDVSKTKALLEVSGPEGSKVVTLDTDPTTSTPQTVTLFKGGIRVTLEDTFIGVEGTVSARLSIQTDIKRIYDGDEFIPNWIAKLGVVKEGNNYKLEWFALKNKNKLEDREVKLFDTYVMDYKATILKKESKDGTMYGAMNAYVAIDPIEPKWKYEEYKVGDEIDDTGYIVDEIKAGTYTKYKIHHPTEPITYLDDIDLAAVDSNLILVGGPVANAVTAKLAEDLGVPSDYEGWKEKYGTGADSGVIIYKEELEKINGFGVVLVAGTDRKGTAAAAKALMEYLSSLG